LFIDARRQALRPFDRESLDRFVGAQRHRSRHGEPEAASRSQIDGELEFCRLRYGKIGGFNLRRARWGLMHYAKRRAQELPISSAGAESVVDHVAGQRLKRNGHMRWTRTGANNLLQVRCAVLNTQEFRNFKRWYAANESVLRAA
jgi:hypothetical protein